MFGFPSMYEAPRRYAQPQRQQYYDPFGMGGYSQPPHRPQTHTSFRNPYGYQYDPRYYNTPEDDSSEEEDYYTQRAPQQQHVDNSYHNLTPRERMYMQQLQQQKQRQQQQEQQEQLLRQRHKQEQQKKHSKKQQSTQHQHQQPPQPKHVPAPQKIDYDKEALKIQRKWRGWNVRRFDIIGKFRAIQKIESEVDAITATPINQHILGLNPAEPLPTTLDTYYVGKVPRNVMLLEHELTAKLLSLDGISGANEIVRARRKALVNKIEGILSKIDAIKKVYSTMTPPPNPTPTISTPSDETTTTQPAPSTSEPADKKKDTEKDSSQQTTEGPRESDGSTATSTPSSVIIEEVGTASPNLSEKLDSMDIQDVSEPSPSSAAPSVSSSSLPSSSIPSSSTPSTLSTRTNRIPSLKQMCYSKCDSLIKRGLVQVQ